MTRLLYETLTDRLDTERLLTALDHHCTCEFDVRDARTTVCAGHATLVDSPMFALRLSFARSLATRLVAEEWAS